MHETPLFRIRNSQVLNATFSKKKNHFLGLFLVFPPIWAYFACKPQEGQKMSKMAFFEPKNRGIQKIISTTAHLCCQTPLGPTGGQKRQFWSFFGDFGDFQDFSHVKVPFWPFWPFWLVGVNSFHGPQFKFWKKKTGGLFDPRVVGDRYIHYAEFQKSWFGAAGWRGYPPKKGPENGKRGRPH